MNNKTKEFSTAEKIDFLTTSLATILRLLTLLHKKAFSDVNLSEREKNAFSWLLQADHELSVSKPVVRIHASETGSSFNKKVGEKLRVYRKKNKMSQIEIAGRLGISQAQYSRYESGHKIPRKLMSKIDALFDNKIRDSIQKKQLEDIFFKNQIHVPSDVLEKVRAYINENI